MTEQLQRSREWLLLNAVECWLHYYSSHNTPTVEQYKQLQAELHDAYMLTLRKDAVERSETPTEPTPKPTTSTRKRTQASERSSGDLELGASLRDLEGALTAASLVDSTVKEESQADFLGKTNLSGSKSVGPNSLTPKVGQRSLSQHQLRLQLPNDPSGISNGEV